MSYTWQEVVRNWLGEGRIPYLSEVVVAAFNRVERTFGREWVEQSRSLSEGVTGTGPIVTLGVLVKGMVLSVLEDVPDIDRFLERLRGREPQAWAELHALYLIRFDEHLEVQSEPLVMVGPRKRHPDWGLREPGDPGWTYVEVTQPQTSEEQLAIRARMQALVDIVQEPGAPFYALEVFLRREPIDDEFPTLLERCRAIVHLSDAYREDLPQELGMLFLNFSSPGEFHPTITARSLYRGLALPGRLGDRTRIVTSVFGSHSPMSEPTSSLPGKLGSSHRMVAVW